MKKMKLIALTLVIALMFSGCSLFAVDNELVQEQVVAKVNGTEITRGEIENELWSSGEFSYELTYVKGYDATALKENSEARAWYGDWMNRMLDEIVTEQLCLQKAPELGVALTDEEKQEKRKDADSQFEEIKDEIRSEVEADFGVGDTDDDTDASDTTATPAPTDSDAPSAEVSASPAPSADQAAIDAEVEKRYQERLGELRFTPDTYYDYLCNKLLASKVVDHVKGLAEVPDEEVKKWYDDTLAVQQKEMDEDPTLFATNMGNNLICTYVPEDTVAVKHVLVTYKDKDLTEVATDLYQDGKKQEAMTLLKGEIEAQKPAMQEVKQRLEAGESIDDIIEEMGEDPGMTSGAAATIGYLVGESTTTYLDEFKSAALALKNVGQVSDPVATYYGLHVLQSIKVYSKGVIPLEEIQDNIRGALLPSKQQTKYDDTIAQWKSEANITYDRARLTNG